MKSRRTLRAAILSAGILCLTSNTLAVDRSWLASGGGTFQTAGNWSGGIVPTNADRAYFDIINSTFYSVNFTASATTDQLVVDDPAFFNVGGGQTYTVDNPSSAIDIGTNSADFAHLYLLSGTIEALGATRLATAAGSAGNLTLSPGTNLLFTQMNVGDAGSGTASVFGTASGSSMVLGNAAAATGTAVFGGQGTLSGALTVGNSGHGTVLFTSGAATLTTNSMTLGEGATGSGTVLLTSSKRVNSGVTAIGSLGTGLVRITDGTLTATSLDLAGSMGGTGTLIVDGQFNAARVAATTVARVGRGGAGTLLLTRGGVGTLAFLTAGADPTGIGHIRVDEQAILNGTSGADIGAQSIGTLDIRSGGDATFGGQVYLGRYNVGAKGALTVDGLGSSMTVASDLIVGNLGTGTLTITGGAMVSANTLLAGTNPGGSGTMIVAGTGAKIDVTSATGSVLGTVSGGVGYLEIGPEASYTHANTVAQLSVHPGSFVKLNGGTLGASTLSAAASQFAWNSGTLILTSSSGGTISASSILGSSLLLDSTHSLKVTQSLNNFGLLTVRDGWLNAGTVTNGAGATFYVDGYGSNIAATVNNSGVLRGVGRITGSLINNANGEVRLTAGEAIEFTSTGNNSGSINLVGGEFRVNGLLINNASGRISGRGLLSTGSIANSGTIQFSGDFSEVFGALALLSGSKVIVSGNSTSTFYGNLTAAAASEFRVSSGTAVFFGTVTGTSNFTGGGVKIFENTATPGPLLTTGSSVVNPGGALTLPSVRETSLTLEGGSVVLIPGSASSRLEELTINDGTIDLNDNELIIDYDGASPIADIRDYLLTGAMFSTTANASANPTMAIGYHENNLGSLTFAGQDVDGNSLMIGYTVSGDATLDGKVNTLDFNELAGDFGQSNRFWEDGDFNYDGFVNSVDFNALIGGYGHQVAIAAPALGTVVPEPAGLGLAIAGFILSRRRRG